MKNYQKMMFKWKKLGKIFDPQEIKGRKWLKEFAQAPCTLVFEDFVRVYFSCRPLRDSGGQYVSYTGFVDFDRKNLTKILNVSKKPILSLGKLGTFDEFGVYPTSVIRNNDDVWAYYGGWTRCESVPYNVAVGLAISRDQGETFKRVGDGPLLSFSPHEPMTVSGPKIRKFNNKWFLWYVAGKKWEVSDGRAESIFKIRMATSDNGLDWNKEDKDLIDNRLEENECQASPDVFFYKGKYHMFFSYKFGSDFRNNNRGYRIGYASSVDIFNWVRNDELAGINLSTEGWDSESMAYPHILELDGNLYMFYLGNQVGRYGFGLAIMENYKK